MINIEDVSVKRGNKTILSQINTQIEQGEFVALVGENGAGKSTLLHTISSSFEYTGDLSFNGKPLTAWSDVELSKQRAVLKQHQHVGFNFSVPEIIAMGRFPYDETQAKTNKIVDFYIDSMELQPLSHRSLNSLSGGEKQRVHMARCLAQMNAFITHGSGKLLLLDEPTSALDLKHQHKLLQKVKEFVRQGNTAIVVIHDLNLATLYADKALLLSKGKLVAQGRPSHVFTKDNLEFVYQTPMHIGVHPTLDLPMIFSEPQELINEISSPN
ncbi:MAG: heme ABC transporter ATP-binding protein [Parashewanella sp.]